jgi:hypothetical protein
MHGKCRKAARGNPRKHGESEIETVKSGGSVPRPLTPKSGDLSGGKLTPVLASRYSPTMPSQRLTNSRSRPACVRQIS